MTTLQAPPVREVSITQLSRDFARLEWETVGENFRYEIHVRSAISYELLLEREYAPLFPNAFTGDTNIFLEISPDVKYWQWKVRAVFKGFEPGEWAESVVGNSTDTNDYDINTQTEFTPSNVFVEQRLTLNNDNLLSERDDLMATLVRPGYEFNANMLNVDSASYWFVTNPGFSSNYGQVPTVCSTPERVIPVVIDDVIYSFERWQEVCKISNDGGNTWQTYKATTSRLGNPVYDCICQQATSFSYLLGHDYLIQGISSTDVDYSHDNIFQYSWASVDLTFDQLDYDLGFGFQVERFTDLAVLPPQVRNKADAFGVDDIMTVVAYENTWVWHNNKFPRIFDNINNTELYGNRVFEFTGEVNDEPVYDEYRIVLNDPSRPDFDEDTSPVVIKKFQYYVDPAEDDYQDGHMYALVTGEWIYEGDERVGVHDPNEIRGVYQLQRTPILDPESGFPQSYENFSWTRVYGETADERENIDEYSVISRDNDDLIVGVNLQRAYGDDTDPAYSSRQVSSGAPGGELHSNPGDEYGTIDDPVLLDPEVQGDVVATEAVQFFKRPFYTSSGRPLRQIVSTKDGVTWASKFQDYYGSAFYNWMNRTKSRDAKSWVNDIMYIKAEEVFTQMFADIPPEEKWLETQGNGDYLFEAPDLTIRGFNGYADGAIIHTSATNQVIGYYKFPYRVSIEADIRWNPVRRVISASLVDYTPITVEPEMPDPDYILDPHLTPLVYKMAPENYLDSDGFYKQFNQYYLDFISKADGTAYNELFNLLNSQDPLSDHYTEYLHKLIYQRNRILDKEKRDAVTKFFLAKRGDFYSTKGILNSYKFLFKLLYNEDVDLEIESLNTFEFYITVDSNNISDDIVGDRIVGSTGSADVTYFDRTYIGGKRYWRLTLNNLIGEFIEGETVTSDRSDFEGIALTGVKGNRIDYNSEDFLNRSRSYYVMKIRSELQLSQYRDDVIRFVHPIGFGFLGITLLTVLVNHGVSVERVETIVDSFRSIRYDNGVGDVMPDITSDLDPDGNRQYDEFGTLLTKPHPLAGTPGIDLAIHDRINMTQGVTVSEYNDYWANPLEITVDESAPRDDVRYTETPTGDPGDEFGGIARTLNPDYNPLAATRPADPDGSVLWGWTAYDRRSQANSTWASAAFSMSDMYPDPDESTRLKDNIGNPYDPETPTQIHIGET